MKYAYGCTQSPPLVMIIASSIYLPSSKPISFTPVHYYDHFCCLPRALPKIVKGAPASVHRSTRVVNLLPQRMRGEIPRHVHLLCCPVGETLAFIRATTQNISHSFSDRAQIQFQSCPREIGGEQDGTGASFSPSASVFLCQLSLHGCSILSSIIRGRYNGPARDQSAKDLCFT